jgi:hypothetical protein
MPRSRSALLVPVSIALTWLSLDPAWGTTFVRMDEEQLLATSEVVVVGTVTAIESGESSGGGIQTYVHVQPNRVIKGNIGEERLVLREPGGAFGVRREWVYGAPEFWVGERSLLFLSRNPDGTLQTNSLSMGKFTLGVDGSGRSTAVREFGYGADVLEPATGELHNASPETQPFVPLIGRLHALMQAASGEAAPAALVLRPQELDVIPTEVHESFTLMGPARWFEPDSGEAVAYYVDSTGDSKLGFDSSRAAIDAALAAWTNVATSSLILVDAGTTTPAPFGGCTGNRIVFNDPYNEIPDPSGCSGVLAIGGYCTNGQTTVVNGTTFSRLVVGKVTFNNGWSGCGGWNQCNVAEVATHEIGHTIGIGHSADPAATMRASAHFDGRCAGLGSDDINAVTFIYPAAAGPLPTSTSTAGEPASASPSSPPPTDTPPPPTNTPRVPTNTPPPAATLTPTPTFTLPPIHDAVIDPIRPLNVTIPKGRAALTTKVHVKVTNADLLPVPEVPGHATRVVVINNDCPAGTVIGAPDFDRNTPGDQDTVQLIGGQSKSAAVSLNIDSAAFAALNQMMPRRCTLILAAVVAQPAGSFDPTQSNNAAPLELSVVDRNTSDVRSQPVLKSVAALKVRIPRGQTSITKTIVPRLGADSNGARLDRTGTLTVSSNCPAKAVSAVNPISAASGDAGASGKMSLVVSIDSAAFTTPHDKCPARCSATLTVSGTGVGAGNATRTSQLLIDVIDKNDF